MYFYSCLCIEDVKQTYHGLVVKWHPDNNRGGTDTTKIMQAINAEYEIVFGRFKNVHRNAEGSIYTASKDSDETAAEFAEVIEKIVHFVNCRIEIIGNWIWVSGNTRHYKEILKNIGFRWSPDKTAWAYHKDPYRKRYSGYSMDELRNKFGSTEVKTESRAALN